jgi:tetratricopeptide (TPR) repeat protein
MSAEIIHQSNVLWEDLNTVYEWGAFLATSVGKRPPSPRDYHAVKERNASTISAASTASRLADGGNGLMFHWNELPGSEPPKGDGYEVRKSRRSQSPLQSSSQSSFDMNPKHSTTTKVQPTKEVTTAQQLSTTNDKTNWVEQTLENDVQSWLIRASGAYHTGHLEIALTAFKRASVLKPNDFKILSDLGAVQQQLWQLNEAATTLERLLSL